MHISESPVNSLLNNFWIFIVTPTDYFWQRFLQIGQKRRHIPDTSSSVLRRLLKKYKNSFVLDVRMKTAERLNNDPLFNRTWSWWISASGTTFMQKWGWPADIWTNCILLPSRFTQTRSHSGILNKWDTEQRSHLFLSLIHIWRCRRAI